MMFDVEKSIATAQEAFSSLISYIRHKTETQDAYTVEATLFRESRKVLLPLLQAYFDQKNKGYVGESVQRDGGVELGKERIKQRQYLSVFGAVTVSRWYYHEDHCAGIIPLDEDVNIPARTCSYFVQDILMRHVGAMTYEETAGLMERFFGLKIARHTVQEIAQETYRDVDEYYRSLQNVARQEKDIVVAAIDGKGVPMVKEEPAEHKVRLGKGEKQNQKKEAVVTAVYSIDPYPRTAKDIVSEVRDKCHDAKRPRPCNKHVRATLEGKTDAICWAAEEVKRRDPENRKHHVCVMDGSVGLWTIALVTLHGFTFILDIFHALEYLWKVAYVFHKEGSKEAQDFVADRLTMLLEGKVGYVIGGMRQMLSKHSKNLSKNQKKILSTVVGYYERNRSWMQYNQYIAAGFPIGSGAVEGACRHLVKDRMEGSGMRWKVPGAEAVLKLRAVLLNGDWNVFWNYHMQQESEHRFGSYQQWIPLKKAA